MTHYDLKSDILKNKLIRSTLFHQFSPVRSMPFSQMTLDKLAKILEEKKLKFRIGKCKVESDVQWEGDCQYIYATLQNFIDWNDDKKSCGPFTQYNNDTHWAYADYMYAKELFSSISNFNVFEEVKWSNLGFSEAEGQDMAVWIGSKGSHTVCHYDTYGYNLVIQVFGCKRWILFPPDDTDCLYPTRIPYEESTVFSKVNILNPDLSKHPRFAKSHPHIITLEAGDMLYVPPHWWHFVENLETSISVNAWFPHKNDEQERISEAVTRLLVSSFLSYQSSDSIANPTTIWVNPTEQKVTDRDENLNFLKTALEFGWRSTSICDKHYQATFEDEKRICTCSKTNLVSLPDVQCFEVPQFCFDHCGINSWKNALDNDVENHRRKRRRLSNENDFLKTYSLQDFVEIVTKPNVINCIRKEMVKLVKDSGT